REEELVRRLRLLGPVVQPMIGVERIVTGIEVTFTMEVAPTRLCDRVDDDWTMRVLGGKVRSEDFELLNHISVGIHRSRAVATRAGNVRPVRRDIYVLRRTVSAGVGSADAVGNIGTVQGALAPAIPVAIDSNYFAIKVRATL